MPVHRDPPSIESHLKWPGGKGRRVLSAVIDSCAWLIAIPLATLLRFEFAVPQSRWLPIALAAVAAVIAQLAVGTALGLYRGRFNYGAFDEVRTVGMSVIASSVFLSVFVITVGPITGIPRSIVFIAFPFVLLLMFAVRYTSRYALATYHRPPSEAVPALVVGAGSLGTALVRTIMTDPLSPLRIVGLLDDDPFKQNLRVHGVPVRGTTDDIASVADETEARMLVVAIGRAESPLLRRLTDSAESAGLAVSVTPPLAQIVSGAAAATDLRKISIEDLIGRRPVDTNVETIAGYVTGRRVLVTGAGGSIGSELCRQIARFGPAQLVMLDRDETGLQTTQLTIEGNGLLDTKNVVLCNIREVDAVNQLFAQHRPEVVFHTAALKHLPLLERYPDEGWKTNVLGTLNLLRAAQATGVGTFVNVSTDKAANPTSVLGQTKHLAERLTAWAAEASGMRYLSVRFGNVIGSRGSMLPTFQTLIEAGGPVTVTHPDITRYFMTIPEACQLVVQAGGIGRPGEVLILDMGEPVRILDIAKRMIHMSGKPVEIVFTGLRPGEKMHEDLVADTEKLEKPFHPQISHARVEPLTPDLLVRETARPETALPRHTHPLTDGVSA